MCVLLLLLLLLVKSSEAGALEVLWGVFLLLWTLLRVWAIILQLRALSRQLIQWMLLGHVLLLLGLMLLLWHHEWLKQQVTAASLAVGWQ